MKKLNVLTVFMLLSGWILAQTPLDSIKVVIYHNGEEQPSMRQVFQNDLWGKSLEAYTQLYDDYDERWNNLSRDNNIYNNDQLIERLTYIYQNGEWESAWRNIFTYPSENEILKQFYGIIGGTDVKAWEISQEIIDDHLINISAKYVEETTGELIERFRGAYIQLSDGYQVVNSRLNNGEWEDYYKVTYLVDNGVIVENTQESLIYNSWTNTVKVVYTYNDNQLLQTRDSYQWGQGDWETTVSSSEIFYYNQVSINPPEIDEQNLIVVRPVRDELYVMSKLGLRHIAIYDMNSRLIYRNNSPRQVEILLTDFKGEYLVEVVTDDDRKKIEQVKFN